MYECMTVLVYNYIINTGYFLNNKSNFVLYYFKQTVNADQEKVKQVLVIGNEIHRI